MSWQSYVTNLKGRQCDRGGIFGHGGETWHEAGNPDSIDASPAQILDLISKIKAGPGFGGVTLGEENFSEISMEKGEHALLKRKTEDKEKRYLCYVALGKSFVLIGIRGGAGERGVMGAVEDVKNYLNDNI